MQSLMVYHQTHSTSCKEIQFKIILFLFLKSINLTLRQSKDAKSISDKTNKDKQHNKKTQQTIQESEQHKSHQKHVISRSEKNSNTSLASMNYFLNIKQSY